MLFCNIIKLYHDAPHTRHPGHSKTLELIKQDHWWPGMHLLVKKWTEGYTTCQLVMGKFGLVWFGPGFSQTKPKPIKTIPNRFKWFEPI
jgi:hypothetical protein